MGKEYVISYDVGTSGVKAALIDENFEIAAMEIENYPIYHPREGWAEQEPQDYWDAIATATKNMMRNSGVDSKSVKGIGFSCQAMGIIPLGSDGEILYRNISWIDGRAEAEAHVVNCVTGKEIYSPKSVICKLLWIKNNLKSVYDKTQVFLDVNGYLKYMATGKYTMERTGACSYSFDLDNLCYDFETFEKVGIDIEKLPPIESSTDITGCLTEKATATLGLETDVIVAGGCNDVEAAAIGSGAVGDGQGHIYLGSSAWICASQFRKPNPGNGFTVSKSPAPQGYLLKGVMQSSGIAVDKAVELLYGYERGNSEIDEFSIIESEVSKLEPGSGKLLVTPWLHGETCPVTTEKVHSTICNITEITTRAHFIKSIREGIGFNLRWIKDNMEELYGIKYEKLNVVGGGGLSDDWMQCLADILHIPLCVTENTRHAGAIGVAVCTFIGYGRFRSFDDAVNCLNIRKKYVPREKCTGLYTDMYFNYRQLYKNLKELYENINT